MFLAQTRERGSPLAGHEPALRKGKSPIFFPPPLGKVVNYSPVAPWGSRQLSPRHPQGKLPIIARSPLGKVANYRTVSPRESCKLSPGFPLGKVANYRPVSPRESRQLSPGFPLGKVANYSPVTHNTVPSVHRSYTRSRQKVKLSLRYTHYAVLRQEDVWGDGG
jgi:hypothetical protein